MRPPPMTRTTNLIPGIFFCAGVLLCLIMLILGVREGVLYSGASGWPSVTGTLG